MSEVQPLVEVRDLKINVSRSRDVAWYSCMLDDENEAVRMRAMEHLGLTTLALALGMLVAVPLGLALERRRAAAESEYARSNAKPAPASPKHSPPRQATPLFGSAPSSKYMASPCEVIDKRLQTSATDGKT